MGIWKDAKRQNRETDKTEPKKANQTDKIEKFEKQNLKQKGQREIKTINGEMKKATLRNQTNRILKLSVAIANKSQFCKKKPLLICIQHGNTRKERKLYCIPCSSKKSNLN